MAGADIVGGSNLAAANTAFVTSVNDVLSNMKEATHTLFTSIESTDGESVDVDVIDGLPRTRVWTGAREKHELRAYKRTEYVQHFERTFRIPIMKVLGDRQGLVAKRLSDFGKSATNFWDQVLVDPASTVGLFSSLLGYDGVALISTAHPAEAGNQSNSAAATLTYSAYKAGRVAMRGFTDYKGRKLGMLPTHLVVGPALEEIAFQCTGSDKLVGINASGEPAAASVVATGPLKNYIGGEVSVVVDDDISGNKWALMDLRNPSVRPLGLRILTPPSPYALDQESDEPVRERKEAEYGIHARAAVFAGAWQCIYGSVA
jgi:phage major head subunit gpT-like protein